MRGCCCGARLWLGINPRSQKSQFLFFFFKEAPFFQTGELSTRNVCAGKTGGVNDWHESALSLLRLLRPPGLMETSLLSALPSLEPAGAGNLLKYLLKTTDVLTRLTEIPDASVFGPDRRLMSSEHFHEELDGIHPGFGGSGRGCARCPWNIPLSCWILGSCHKGARPDLVCHQQNLSLLRSWAWPGWGGL